MAGIEVVLVVNARARSGAGELPRRAERALRAGGAAVDVARTEDEDAFAAVCRAAGARRVVLLGGDGTVHAAANAGVPDVDFAVIPGGLANNVARALRIPRDVDAAARLALTGAPRPVDVLDASAGGVRRCVVEGLSAGLHAVARSRYHAASSDAVFDGVRTALWGLRRFAGATAQLRLAGADADADVDAGDDADADADAGSDGDAAGPGGSAQSFRAPVTVALGQLFVANLPYFAFGLRVAPQALPDDGAFDVVALPPVRRRAVPLQLARVARGAHVGRPGVRTWRARSLELVVDGSPVVADTVELPPGPVRIAARPGALRLIRG